MSPHQQQQIYLDREYPCPCYLHGRLQQIFLTEAFGCDRCHHLFVMQEDSLAIEEVGGTYPYKRRYYWDGKRLRNLRSLPNGTFWTFLGSPQRWTLWIEYLSIISVLLTVLRLYCGITPTNPSFNLVLSMAITIVVSTIIMLWLFDQR